ncbi:MAG: amidophosphoribosyltransferase [Deltaproteobacteria bacterium]|nr:amidophosphoribosyltransferase [Deltaproteobacteria bacterium]MBI3387236.1 amidophosphoribosyltransferase [Deltaproteobacteria bacterium]
MFDRFREECGVVGIFGHPEAANLVYLGLYALQHRGQEGAGIVSANAGTLISHRGLGLVADVFNEDIIRRLEGSAAIGHNRYSTAGKTLLKNTQPFVVEYGRGGLAVAHNGNLVNAIELREQLEERGSIFQSTVDTEVIVHLIATARGSRVVDRVVAALSQVRGAYSLLFLTPNEMIAARDPNGFRPLVLGRIKDSVVVASESCALDLVGADFDREVEPGEVVVISDRGVETYHPFPATPRTSCVFEYIYFARPDSRVYGRNVYQVRKELGRQLAREQPAEADLVIPVPDSGVPAALGFAEESGLPFDMGLIRNHYVGRTFIEPQDAIRHFGVKVKLNAQAEVLKGKRVVVVDDSIVRGTTSRKLVAMLRHAGAKEVHMRISSPPTTGSCFYGVDTPSTEELIAHNNPIEGIRQFVGADSLGYLTERGMYAFLKEGDGNGFCAACFTGRYPVAVTDEGRTHQLVLFDADERG